MHNDILDAYINIYKNSLGTELFFGKLFEKAYEVFYFNKSWVTWVTPVLVLKKYQLKKKRMTLLLPLIHLYNTY